MHCPYSFWLVTTSHLEDRLWFRDDEDFKYAMNLVAVLSVSFPGKIICFVLMSNHVHFVLQCTRKQAEGFINKFKGMYSRYCTLKYSDSELLRDNDIDIRELSINDESFERAVAYVQMNPPVANICLEPGGYAWGTGDTFFKEHRPPYHKAGSMSARALTRLTHSKMPIPPDYLIDQRGFVAPESYVPVEYVETIFRTPNRMTYFLRSSSKAKRMKEGPSFKDQSVLAGLKDLCVSMFQVNEMGMLSDSQKSELVRQLRYRFSSDPNQLARVCKLSYEEVCRLLELL